MSKSESTYADKVMSGEALFSDIDDFVESWHDSIEDLGPLPEFLGLTEEEYSLWVEQPDSLRFIFAGRRAGVTPKRAGDLSNVALAARATSDVEAAGVLKWLIATGRVEG
ncbi:hypothetical protein ACFVZ8_01185 [Streptomyces sp. NPDC059558]|uniref:hypothetical protein n=1 Tax=Streptomyces TaxID=1883 RepID=UPI003406512C